MKTFLARAAARLAAARRARHQAAHLATMPDAVLRDIGLSRHDLARILTNRPR